MMQFVKDDIIASKEDTKLGEINIDDGKNWKKSTSIEIGMTAKTYLSKLSNIDKKTFLLNVCFAMIKTINYMKAKFSSDDQFLKDLRFFFLNN